MSIVIYIPKGKVYIEFWDLKDDEAYLERAKDRAL